MWVSDEKLGRGIKTLEGGRQDESKKTPCMGAQLGRRLILGFAYKPRKTPMCVNARGFFRTHTFTL